jgi:hypothetical protein
MKTLNDTDAQQSVKESIYQAIGFIFKNVHDDFIKILITNGW